MSGQAASRNLAPTWGEVVPPPERAAAILAVMAEDWLRRLARDGSPPPGPEVAGVLALLALAAPQAAAKCPRLLQLAGPEARLSCSASAPEAFVAALGLPGASSASVGAHIGIAEAARLLRVSPRRVRQLCAAGRLHSRRGLDGRWRVEPASAAAYAGRRADASRERATA